MGSLILAPCSDTPLKLEIEEKGYITVGLQRLLPDTALDHLREILKVRIDRISSKDRGFAYQLHITPKKANTTELTAITCALQTALEGMLAAMPPLTIAAIVKLGVELKRDPLFMMHSDQLVKREDGAIQVLWRGLDDESIEDIVEYLRSRFTLEDVTEDTEIIGGHRVTVFSVTERRPRSFF